MSKAVLKRLGQRARERMGIATESGDNRVTPSSHPASSSCSHPPKLKQRRSRAKFPAEEVIAHGPSGDITTADLPYHPPLDVHLDDNNGHPTAFPSFISFVPDDTPQPTHASRIHITTDTRSRHARAKEAAAIRWNHVIIPSLIRPFMLFERERLLTQAERTVQPEEPCRCGKKWRVLQVICVYFERLESIALTVCGCPSRTAATQLVNRGLFPCAPLHPSLAVSMDMLEFVAELFVQQAPNE